MTRVPVVTPLKGDLTVVDEITMGGDLHIERMHNAYYWMRVGEATFEIRATPEATVEIRLSKHGSSDEFQLTHKPFPYPDAEFGVDDEDEYLKLVRILANRGENSS